MPTNLPDQNWTVPAGPDPANNPLGFTDFAGDVLQTVLLRYPNTATRDAFNGSRVAGDLSFVTGRTWYDRWTGSKWLPAIPYSVSASADQTVNNTAVLVNSNQLILPLPVANTVYGVSVLARYSSNTTADIKFSFALPAGATAVFGGPFLDSAAGSATGSAFFGETITPAAVASGGTGTTAIVKIEASVSVGATTGNVIVQFAQNTANASNTTLNTLSYMTVSAIG